MDVEQGSSDSRFGGCRTADAPDSRTLPALAQRVSDVDALACGREELADVVAAAQAVINAATAVQDSGDRPARRGRVRLGRGRDDRRGPPRAGSRRPRRRRHRGAGPGCFARAGPATGRPRRPPRGRTGPSGRRHPRAARAHRPRRAARRDARGSARRLPGRCRRPRARRGAGRCRADRRRGPRRAPASRARSALRRRCRRLLARISPDLLRQRAERVRSECGLRRWVAEPGVDAWWGTFPSEDAAAAWAAIDDLARRSSPTACAPASSSARAKALTDLVARPLHRDRPGLLTVPAGAAAPCVTRCAVGRVRALGEVRAATPAPRPPAEPTTSSRCAGCGRRSPRSSPRAWLDAHLAPGPPAVECDAHDRRAASTPPRRPATGHTEAMAALVRARDGRCRFPGCSVAARFCDLDHVRPWPAGPTAAENLACLCRRHHRIKQRPGWRVRMMPGAALEWTDPTGRVRTTTPIDALAALVLRAADGAPAPSPVAVGPGRPSRSARWSSPWNTSRVPAPAPGQHRVEYCRTPSSPRFHVEGGRPGPHRRASGRRGRRSRWPDLPPF